MRTNYLFDYDEVPVFIRIMRQLIVRNRNMIAAWTGQTGSGKSYSAISTAALYSYIYDIPFGAENICFTPGQLMQRLNSGQLKKGSCIILDEGGVAINARQWQSKINQLLGFLMQTFRHRNYITFICVPDLEFVDKTVRKLLHAYVETEKIDHKKGLCICKPFFLNINKREGKIFYVYARYRYYGDSHTHILKRLGIRKAPKPLLNDYEQKKLDYTNRLNKKIEQGVMDADDLEPGEKRKLTKTEFAFIRLREDLGLTDNQLGHFFGISKKDAQNILEMVKKKGHVVASSRIDKTSKSDLLREFDQARKSFDMALVDYKMNKGMPQKLF